MTPPPVSSSDHIDTLRRDHTALASSLSALVLEINRIKEVQSDHRTLHEVAKVQNANIDEKLDGIKEQITGIYGIAKIFLTALISAFMIAVVAFVVRGGMNI